VHRRHALLIFMLCLVPLLASCGPPWKTSVQAAPNPFIGQTRFGVIPVTYDRLIVGDKSESEWMSEKDGEQRASWQEDKGGINEKFTAALVEGAASDTIQVIRATDGSAAPYLLRPNVTFIEPGVFTAFFNKNTVMKMTVQITDPTGRVLDEVLIERTVAASMTNPSTGGRMRDAAEQLGNLMARYLRFRVKGEG
jgi:hypothetical protein